LKEWINLMIKCPICGKSYVEITPSHVKKHGLTMAEFKEKYPEVKCALFPVVMKSMPHDECAAYANDGITKRMRRER
jgi:hypothetical protein